MHKKRKRELTEFERQERAGVYAPFLTRKVYPQDQREKDHLAELDRLRAEWDELYAEAGEGPAHMSNAEGGTYQWVRVVNDAGKVLGTFFHGVLDGQVEELFIVPPQRGLPPNPYVHAPLTYVRWERWKVELCKDPEWTNHRSNPDNPSDVRPYSEKYRGVDWSQMPWHYEYAFSGMWDAKHNDGQRNVIGVMPLPASNEDHRFQFRDGTDGFTVRGSKLAPALLAVRSAGEKTVTLHMLKHVIARM